MKKILSVITCLCMLFAFVPTVVTAAEDQNTVNAISISLKEPEIGEKPTTTATISDNNSVQVTDVAWHGDFDENGCFKKGGIYSVSVSVAIKPGLNMTISDWYATQFLINGYSGVFEYRQDSKTSGVIHYIYTNFGMPHQNHCLCGGNILLGEHTSHKEQTFRPWNGKNKISYVDDVAYVYLTSDVTRNETFNVPGGKTLTICLNGHTIHKTGQGRVINISSGGVLRLCDCSVMQNGKITGGSHQMGGGVHNGGTFIMYGGKIINNQGTYGGGFWNNYNFFMYGGEICYNDGSYGGGVWNANSGDAEFIIFGGSINKNTATYGGGLWNNDNGNVSMKGGEFRENVAGKCGGAVWNQGKNFFLEEGYIYKNFAPKGAGFWTQSTLTMSGGRIIANEAFDSYGEYLGYGGGVWINEKSLFQMKGGEIQGNSADNSAGGVWVNHGAEFVMHGGVISGNMARTGAGVYINRNEGTAGTMRLGGTAMVKGNKSSYAGGGVYVKGVLEVNGGMVSENFSDSGYKDLALEAEGKVVEGTSLPTEFIDVPANAYFYKPVLWALEKQITNGTSEITFSPYDKCNLAEVLTFLWRAAGSPEVKTSPLIADVYKNDYYYMAAYWAQNKGIFSRALYPRTSSNRLSTVYFIWCAAGRPSCKTQLKFTDLTDKKYDTAREAVAWAVEQGITNGTSSTTFSPSRTCTRAEIITFLHRAAAKGVI